MDRRELLIAGGSASAIAALALAAPAAAHGGTPPATRVTHGFHATMSAQPGRGDDLVALLLRAPAFETPDCLVFLVGRSASDRDKVFVTEGWTSQEAHGRFFDSDVAKAYIAELIPLVTGDAVYADELIVGGKAVLS